MRKIPTLFVRDFETEPAGRFVTQEVTPGCSWVMNGLGVATRKWNGTCVRFHEGEWWARREVKRDKVAPDGFIELERDAVTGKTMGWEPAEQSGYWSKIRAVLDRTPGDLRLQGTYELVGPSVNGNPDGLEMDHLMPHGRYLMSAPDRSYGGLVEMLRAHPHIEGLVFWRTESDPHSGMVKIKARDFRELAQ